MFKSLNRRRQRDIEIELFFNQQKRMENKRVLQLLTILIVGTFTGYSLLESGIESLKVLGAILAISIFIFLVVVIVDLVLGR